MQGDSTWTVGFNRRRKVFPDDILAARIPVADGCVPLGLVSHTLIQDNFA